MIIAVQSFSVLTIFISPINVLPYMCAAHGKVDQACETLLVHL
jgi:hypothetical protein